MSRQCVTWRNRSKWRDKVVEELLGKIGRWRRCMSRLKDLLRRWSMEKKKKSQEERGDAVERRGDREMEDGGGGK